jgi:hypothetical protein
MAAALKKVEAAEGAEVAPARIYPCVVTISGHPGRGKSTLALTMAQEAPVYVLETEGRMDWLLAKMGSTPFPVEPTSVTKWEEIKEFFADLYLAVLRGEKPVGTLLIDSGSDYKDYAHNWWADNEKTFPTTQWAKLYTMMDNPIKAFKKLGMTVIVTVRAKAQYVNDKWDGKTYRPEFYKNQEYLSDAILVFNQKGEVEVQKNTWADCADYIVDEESVLVYRTYGRKELHLPTLIRHLQGV